MSTTEKTFQANLAEWLRSKVSEARQDMRNEVESAVPRTTFLNMVSARIAAFSEVIEFTEKQPLPTDDCGPIGHARDALACLCMSLAALGRHVKKISKDIGTEDDELPADFEGHLRTANEDVDKIKY